MATAAEVRRGWSTRRAGIDEWKRRRLIEAGADLVVAGLDDAARLVAYLWGEAAAV
jgi:hypothetical protein